MIFNEFDLIFSCNIRRFLKLGIFIRLDSFSLESERFLV